MGQFNPTHSLFKCLETSASLLQYQILSVDISRKSGNYNELYITAWSRIYRKVSTSFLE